MLALATGTAAAEPMGAEIDTMTGQPADIASSAYLYRADRKAADNPPEAWVLLMQYANLPFDKPVDVDAPAVKKALCGLLWEEVRPVRRVELSWPAETQNRPAPQDLMLAYFDGSDGTAHTWWNPRTVREAAQPDVSADGCTYRYAIPVDTWGVVVAVRGEKDAGAFAVPALRALVPDAWKRMDVEIEWGYDDARAALPYDGHIEAYDGVLTDVQPLHGDTGTTLTGPDRLAFGQGGRFRAGACGSACGTSAPRAGAACGLITPRQRTWPARSSPCGHEPAASRFSPRTWRTVPILAPEYGFFVRATARKEAKSEPPSATAAGSPKELLATKMDTIPGVPLVRGWATNVIPWFGANPTDEPGTAGSLRIPARCVAMHPVARPRRGGRLAQPDRADG